MEIIVGGWHHVCNSMGIVFSDARGIRTMRQTETYQARPSCNTTDHRRIGMTPVNDMLLTKLGRHIVGSLCKLVFASRGLNVNKMGSFKRPNHADLKRRIAG
jgi:hypothetical protein